MVRPEQKPDANFQDSKNVVSTSIAADEPRAINTPCQATDFQGVFEIPVSELRKEKYRTMISVDITDTSGKPIITPGARILRQITFKDAVPWIVVTLFDTYSH